MMAEAPGTKKKKDGCFMVGGLTGVFLIIGAIVGFFSGWNAGVEEGFGGTNSIIAFIFALFGTIPGAILGALTGLIFGAIFRALGNKLIENKNNTGPSEGSRIDEIYTDRDEEQPPQVRSPERVILVAIILTLLVVILLMIALS